MTRFADADALAYRLSSAEREIVFLVGAPLTAAHVAGGPGVPGVSGVVELIRAEFKQGTAAREKLEARLSGVANPYQAAFEHMIQFCGVPRASAVVREAVVQARLPAVRPKKAPADPECGPLENDLDGWHLPRGAEALGKLVARRANLGRTVLTTNFDPLLELAIRKGGGQAFSSKFVRDGSLEQVGGLGAHVAHLHGYWFGGDTLHTTFQLGQKRPQLEASLARLFRGRSVVVMAYGGWDDIFTTALRTLAADPYADSDVMWCFYESDGDDIAAKYRHVLEPLQPAIDQGRAVVYAGVDCHEFLPRVARELECLAPEISFVPARDHAFVGRAKEREVLLDALERTQPVQILGARKMGKSSLLRWAEQTARELRQKPVAFVNARGLAGRSPGELVLAFADALGCRAKVYRALHEETALPDPAAAARVLPQLGSAVLIVDEAETLAERADHGFDKGFFDVLRAEGQAGRLQWISSSEQDLFTLFESKGLSSQFLNDAVQVVAGALDEAEAAELLGFSSHALRDFALSLGGTLPPAVRWMAERLPAFADDTGAAEAKFRGWIQPLFRGWWMDLTPAQRAALKGIAAGPGVNPVAARTLVALGLAVVRDGRAQINGRAWHDFVAAV